jgi:hypothetical protein
VFQVLKNFANSEKAVASGVLVVASSAMVFTGDITPQEWMEYTKMVLGIYVGGKTVQGAVSQLAGRNGAVEAAKAKETEVAATASLEVLTEKVSGNDAAADKALDDKFGDKE